MTKGEFCGDGGCGGSGFGESGERLKYEPAEGFRLKN
jgi:hypothetical protein